MLEQQTVNQLLNKEDATLTAGEIKGVKWLLGELDYISKKLNK